MFARIAVCVAVLTFGVGLWAQTTQRAPSTDEARGIADRIRALEAESDRLAAEARTLLGDLRKLEAERDRQVVRVREAQAAIGEGQAAIESAAQRMLALEAERLKQLPEIERQLMDLYKRGRSGYARLLLNAGGIREFGRATRVALAMLRTSQARIDQHRATIDALTKERATLDAELTARRARETQARQAQAAATRAVADHAALLMQIDAQRDVNARLAGELQIEQERLSSQPAAAVPAPAGPTTAPVAPAASSLAGLRGSLLWPVSGRVVGRFGRMVPPTAEPTSANGIEIASREGNPVRALQSGTVSFTGPFAGFGNLVIVDHGGNTHSLYGYLGSLSVNRDAMVQSGTELGRVGAAPTGDATLYLEVRIDGRSVDPIQWMRPL